MKNRKLLFHFITFFLLISYLAFFIYKLWKDVNLESIFLALGALSPLIIAYFTLGDTIRKIQPNYGTPFSDYCSYLLKFFPRPSRIVSGNTFSQVKNSLKDSIREFCIKETQGTKLEIKEINIPFEYVFHGEIKKEQAATILNHIALNHTVKINEQRVEKIFIIGAPGAGKSYTLKKYILHLLQKKSDRIPIFLPISSWTTDLTIKNWIINTALKMYEVGKDGINTLLSNENEQFLLMMDGLDELDTDDQISFLEKIKDEFENHNAVITCRKDAYENLLKANVIPSIKLYKLLPIEENRITDILRKNLSKPEDSPFLKDYSLEGFNSPLLISLLIKVFQSLSESEKADISQLNNKEKLTDKLWNRYIELIYCEKSTGKVSLSNKLGNEPGNKLGNEPGNEKEIENKNDQKIVKFHFTENKLRQYSASMAKVYGNKPFVFGEIQPIILDSVFEKILYILFSRVTIGIIVSIGISFLLNDPLKLILAGSLGGLMASVLFLMSNKKQFFFRNESLSTSQNISFNKGIYKYPVFNKIRFYFTYFIGFFLPFILYFTTTGQKDFMHYFFAIPESNIGVLFAIIFTIIFGIHDEKYNLRNDIQLIEKINYRLNYFKAVIIGILLGIAVSLGLGFIGVLYFQLFNDPLLSFWKTAINPWKLHDFVLLSLLFFPVSAFLGIFIGLSDPEKYKLVKAEKEKQVLSNYSTIRTLKSALIFSTATFILGSLISSAVCKYVLGLGWDGVNRGITTAIAMGIFVGMWWGGKDLIKLWVIRLILFLKGKVTLKYSHLLRDLEILGIIKRQGALFSIVHDTLFTFLNNQSNKAFSRKTNLKLIFALIILLILIFTSIPVFQRIYWTDQNSGIDSLKQESGFDTIGINRVKIVYDGNLVIKSKGLISVGRIVGHITALGTNTGIFCFPLKHAFDVDTNFNHGALLYYKASEFKEGEDTLLHPVYQDQQIPLLGTYFPNRLFVNTSLHVNAGDTIGFLINDIEWKNNSGIFKVEMNLVSKTMDNLK